MGTLKQFKLPDVGEGLTEGEILQWLVAVGDTVTVNQPLCEVETAKAAVELPSPYAGTVTALLHEAGDTVDVGTPIITIDVGGPDTADEGAAGEVAAGLIGGGPPRGRAGGPQSCGSARTADVSTARGARIRSFRRAPCRVTPSWSGRSGRNGRGGRGVTRVPGAPHFPGCPGCPGCPGGRSVAGAVRRRGSTGSGPCGRVPRRSR